MTEADKIIKAGGEVASWVHMILAEGRRYWLAGDRWFLARQAEMHAMRAQECRCEENTCAGCVCTLAVANILEAQAAKVQGAGTDEEFTEREKARAFWKAMRALEAKRAGDIARRVEEKSRAHSHPAHWSEGK